LECEFNLSLEQVELMIEEISPGRCAVREGISGIQLRRADCVGEQPLERLRGTVLPEGPAAKSQPGVLLLCARVAGI
jgi:hypothetical protein